MRTKEHGFVSNVCSRIQQMTIRSFGATVVLNGHREQSMEGLVNDGIAVNSSMEEIDIAEVFDRRRPHHDGAVIVDMALKGEFAPRVRSVRNHLRIVQNVAPPAGLIGRGTRFFAAYCASIITDALIIVVSEACRTISLFHRGTMQLDTQLDAFETRLRLASGGLVQTLVGFYE
ncbi:hypothetical protein AAVH_14119 [Aphelenchoides avenae]|nr:hypothetical protein AAVH_14119 [Aphelenchus avenae]